MSIHWEYLAANTVSVEYLDERDVYSAINPTKQNVLAIVVDDGVIITGTAEELAAVGQRIIDVVRAGPTPYEGRFG